MRSFHPRVRRLPQLVGDDAQPLVADGDRAVAGDAEAPAFAVLVLRSPVDDPAEIEPAVQISRMPVLAQVPLRLLDVRRFCPVGLATPSALRVLAILSKPLPSAPSVKMRRMTAVCASFTTRGEGPPSLWRTFE